MADDKVWYAVIHPKIWNGYWDVGYTNRFIRWLGRKLHNKYVYWLGFQVRWVTGLAEVVYKEIGWKWYGSYEKIGKDFADYVDELAKQAE